MRRSSVVSVWFVAACAMALAADPQNPPAAEATTEAAVTESAAVEAPPVETTTAASPAAESTADAKPRGEPRSTAPSKPLPLKLHLIEGSIVTGELSVESLTVQTEFGTLSIPVNQVVSFTPGLDSHPQQKVELARLVEQLASNVAAQRDEAQKKLAEYGSAIRPLLQMHVDDEDAERRKRIRAILDELDENIDEEGPAVAAWIDEDRLETPQFTVVGRIAPRSFGVKTQFGELTVALADVKNAERGTSERPEIRKTISVSGVNLVQFQYQSALRVNRGDRVSVSASGSIVMSPWGNNAVSTPQGDPRFQWYIPNKIPGGALVARIGSGPVFLVGNSSDFVATRSGNLEFAVAMNPQFANQGYQFPGEYSVKIRVNPEH